MSFSSVVSYESTSSSSSSSDSSRTGSFSPSASFSSQSTVCNHQYYTQPFGKPEYNYFWVENKSKSNPDQSYYYNVKSHSVVWNRPVPRTVLLPSYSSGWVPLERKSLSDCEEVITVSEDETPQQKRKRLRIRKRNRQLFTEDHEHSIKVVSMNKAIRSKKSLEVFWKLFRLPGETIEQIKERLLNFEEENSQQVVVKTEDTPPQDDQPDQIDIAGGVQIKQEPMSDNDNDDAVQILEVKKANQELASDSDSDQEHVSAIIKQEYAMNYDIEDSELDNDNEEQEEEPEEEAQSDSEQGYQSLEGLQSESESEPEQEKSQDSDTPKVYTTRAKIQELEMARRESINQSDNNPDSPKDNEEEDAGSYIPLDDFCTVEIVEGDNKFDSWNRDTEDLEDNINWTFERKSKFQKSSALTLSNLAFNPLHRNYQLKRKRKQLKKRATPRIKLEPDLSEPENVENFETVETGTDGPIICDMYGTRTINYNYEGTNMKVPSWQARSRLSASSDSDSSGLSYPRAPKAPKMSLNNDNNDNSVDNVGKDASALELKSWFPKSRKNRRRVRNVNSDGSESSWCDDLECSSSDSDADRKKKAAPKPANKLNKLNKFKRSKVHVKNTDSESVDLSRVKVEKDTGKPLENNAEVSKIEEEEKETAYTSDSDDSSSSGCSCSRSSCSCKSKSSSSSNDENEDDNKASENLTNSEEKTPENLEDPVKIEDSKASEIPETPEIPKENEDEKNSETPEDPVKVEDNRASVIPEIPKEKEENDTAENSVNPVKTEDIKASESPDETPENPDPAELNE